MEISFTRLRVYRECPWKYQLQFVAGWRIPLTPPGSLGLSLHRTLECFHRRDNPSEDDLWACYESRWLSAGYSDEQARESWRGKGRRILERYLADERERRAVIEAVEREFIYPLGRHEVRGMIDRIDRHPDGRLEVIDYKTYGSGDEKGPRDGLQLRFYGLGCREALAKEPDLLTWYFVAESRKITVPYDAAGEEGLKALILETADRIEAGKFPPDTSFCPRCDFRQRCTHSVAQEAP
ncbi:MAG: PD-(D/E)XK nuclease family protein [Elusimicrobia bacterium]|nr:PD-(D/E)XK nuclease family protein [Elusimicrobiota bacterium]